MPALPPDQVRRLGDRRRRRQHAGVALASLAVVGVLGGGGLWLQGLPGGQDRPGPAATSTALAGDVRTDLPDDFPLAAGLEVIGSEVDERQLTDSTLTLCDELVGLEGADGIRADRSLAAGGEGESAAYARSIAVFDNEQQATDFVDGVERAGRDCSGSYAGAVTELVDIDPAATGIADLDVPPAQAVDLRAYGEGSEDGGSDASSYRVYRVANAVLVSSTYDPTGGPESLEALTLDGAQLDLDVLTAMQYYAGRDLRAYSGADPVEEPDDGSDGSDGSGASIGADRVLTVQDLPDAGNDRGPWEQVAPTDEPTLVCEPRLLQVLDFDAARYAEFTATIEPGAGTTPDPDAPFVRDSAVSTAVLAFGSPTEARAAYDTVTSWISTCDAPLRGQDVTVTAPDVLPVVPDGAEGSWWSIEYAAPEACTDDCDAAWFGREGAVLVGSDLVLVSTRDLGGPLEPEGLDLRMDALVTAASAKAAYGSAG